MTLPIRTTSAVRLGLLSTAALGMALTLMTALPLRADDNPVLAKVNGSEIRQSDVTAAEKDIGASLAQLDPASRQASVVQLLIDLKLVTKAAEDKKIADTPDFKQKLAFTRSRLLMDTLLDQEGKAAVTDAALKKVYDDAAKQISGEEEVHARHILVGTEAEAKEIIAKLKKGADFAELAKKESKDPGASDGGDLGFFTKDQMVPEFADVAFSLKKGQISDPVKTKFGWHIIEVEDTRENPVPTLDQVRDQIEVYLTRRAQQDEIQKLRKAADVERTDAPADAKTPAKPE